MRPYEDGVADPIRRAARRGAACVVPSPAVTGTALNCAFCFFVHFHVLHRKCLTPLKWGMIYLYSSLRHLLLPLGFISGFFLADSTRRTLERGYAE